MMMMMSKKNKAGRHHPSDVIKILCIEKKNFITDIDILYNRIEWKIIKCFIYVWLLRVILIDHNKYLMKIQKNTKWIIKSYQGQSYL